ncbi:MAG: CPBP family intramembrane metalloprotease [Patescibacteria group bacterium]|nr:CPBP family intramembrane metalloprotease [Patescibacteria group bacterium]
MEIQAWRFRLCIARVMKATVVLPIAARWVWSGLRRYVFSRPESQSVRSRRWLKYALNAVLAYAAMMAWLWVMVEFMNAVLLVHPGEVRGIVSYVTVDYAKALMWALNAGAEPQIELFLAICLISVTPLTEEALFRLMPLTLVEGLSAKKVRAVAIAVCGIGFGMAHGHPLACMIQGVLGLIFAWLYLRNSHSQLAAYLSCVVAHAAYNGSVMLVGWQ